MALVERIKNAELRRTKQRRSWKAPSSMQQAVTDSLNVRHLER